MCRAQYMDGKLGMIRKIALFFACVLLLQVSYPAAAQAPRFDGEGLREMCLRGACVFATQVSVDNIERLGLSEAESNSQLGVVAAILFQTADGADRATLEQLADALLFLAQYTTDNEQRASFIRVASQIADGSFDLFDLATPFAVSPS